MTYSVQNKTQEVVEVYLELYLFLAHIHDKKKSIFQKRLL